jgi:hypothetical protein
MLEFTFNEQRDTATPSSRHWQWFLKQMKWFYNRQRHYPFQEKRYHHPGTKTIECKVYQ